MHQAQKRHHFVRQGCRCIAVEAENVACFGKGMSGKSANNYRPYRMQAVFERSDNTVIAAAAAHRPEQIAVLVGTCM
jgi:hypothetical protein